VLYALPPSLVQSAPLLLDLAIRKFSSLGYGYHPILKKVSKGVCGIRTTLKQKIVLTIFEILKNIIPITSGF
jgi:hypothetical protein